MSDTPLVSELHGTIAQLRQRISDLLAGQATLQRTIHGLEVDNARLERQVEELREAVAALMAPPPSEERNHSGYTGR